MLACMGPERRAVVLLLGLAVSGQALRVWWNRPGSAPGAVSLFPGVPTGAPLAHRDSGLALARPLASGETIDIDRAPAPELARLPRVGMSLARAIVADREARGPFGSLEQLDRVPGVGPGLLRTIGPHAAFSARGSAPASPPLAAGLPAPPAPDRGAGAPPGPLNLNTATVAQLEALPLIGPALAQRIVAYRTLHGGFPVVDSLVRVPGIGPATLARLRDRLRVD
jgi:competence protein ComEA